MIKGKKGKLLWDDPTFSKQSNSADAVTGVFAKEMISQADIINVPLDVPLTILDNACGNGIVTHELQQIFKRQQRGNVATTCGDLADAMLEAATERMQKEGWRNTTIVKLDAQDTKLPDSQFTHILTNFGVMLVPQPDNLLNECYRMLKPDGLCAFTTWKQVGWVDDIQAALASIPGLPNISIPPDELARGFGAGRWDDEDYITRTMTQHNFSDIEVRCVPNTSSMTIDEDSKRIVRACTSILTKKFWTEDQQSAYDNDDLVKGVEAWLLQKYDGKPIEWHWIALVTTGRKR